MAEQEVIKHTKKVYKIWNSKEHSVWHKLKEFAIEICIIVFAVTLSIWLHSWSEHRHQQQDVKDFLLGLREDLKNDIHEMTEDSISYIHTTRAFTYIVQNDSASILSPDTLNAYSGDMFNTTGLIANNGRFEGFKSSGKVGFIEDKVLQNLILDLYQETIPSLLASTNGYTEFKKEFFRFVNENRKRNPDNLATILLSDQGQNICNSLLRTRQILARYSICMQKCRQIIDKVNQLYPE
jgi:hypothetical protein